ncbi:MAG: uroporphyrinogen decarboxylase family protein [Kiritimatiellae bacterium]|nr:uroporphyrinogen decarboxylase family protein [Kiritimatiellia bacterium]
MSKQLALDAVHMKSVKQVAHTEYSLGYNVEYCRKLTGKDPSDPEAMAEFQERWAIDFAWAVSGGLHGDWAKRGRTTEMGHAVYAADGSDLRQEVSCPFTTPEEVWAFDAVREYGLPDFEAQVRAYQAEHAEWEQRWPRQLVTGGYYRTIVSGAIATFGWDMLLLALSEPAKMEPVFDSFYRFTKFHMDAWARTSAEVIIQHDDFVWTEGAFMNPEIYRKVLIPRYAEMWKTLHAAGKKVLFCSDGNFVEFAEDIVAAGADGLIFEPMNDFAWMAERFGRTHCLVGSCVDCRDMAFGHWDKVKSDMDRTFALARTCPGIIFATGNHLPGNIPVEMMEKYIAYFLEHRDMRGS